MIRFENIALRYKNTALASQQAASAWSPFKRGKAEPQDRTQNNSARSTTSPEILHNINLDLERGSFHFITGVSGAGKSSLLNLINLSIRPTSGKIYLAGQDTTVLDADERALMRRRIGVVFQDYRLLDHLSVEENVALPLRIAGAYDQQRRNDVLDLLTWVGLGDKLNLPPRVLSGGQKQRVALARAVITRPQLLLADEPTGNLDDGMGTRLVRLFEELNRIGTTVIIATHNQDLLRAFRFPVINLKDGKAKVDQIGNLYPLTKEASSQPSDKPVFSS